MHRSFTTGLSVVVAAAVAGPASAVTALESPSVYRVNEGVAFLMGNTGANHFPFSWSDVSGSFSGITDPTLILKAGETYTFARTTGSHPFIITTDALPVTGTDGSFARTTTSGTVLDAVTVGGAGTNGNPNDFRADPAPTTDFISWTPTGDDIGTYFYTCRVTGHPNMTGKIIVVPTPASLALLAPIGLLAARRRRA